MIYRLCPPAALLAVLLIPSAQATNFFVASNADSGAGSLRTAINSANATPNGTHTITFGSAFPAGGTIALLSTLPTIAAQSLTINGGNRAPVISGQNAHQILRVSGTNTSLEIRNLEFRDGWATQNGGCIYDASFAAQTVGVLYLSQVAFSGCSVSASSLASGGGDLLDTESGTPDHRAQPLQRQLGRCHHKQRYLNGWRDHCQYGVVNHRQPV